MNQDEAQKAGYKHWDSYHPGYTIDALNEMLKDFCVEIKVLMISGEVWYKAEEIAKEKRPVKGRNKLQK